MLKFKVIAEVQDWGWNDPYEHQFLQHRPDLYGPRLVEELIKVRSQTEVQFRMMDRHAMCLVNIIELKEIFFDFDYTPDKYEDEEFYSFMLNKESPMETLLNMDSVDLIRGDEFYFLRDGSVVQTKCKMLSLGKSHFTYKIVYNYPSKFLRLYANHQMVAKILD